MRKTTLLAFIISSVLCMASPVIFYNSYADYKAKKGDNKGEFKKLSISDTRTSLLVIQNDKKKEYNHKDLEKLWGFEMDGVLFRHNGGNLYEVLYLGEKVTVYESALNRMNAINEGKAYTPGSAKYDLISFCAGNEGEVALLLATMKGKIKENLRKQFPQFSNIFDCMENLYKDKDSYTTMKAVKCFQDFDKK